jgi:hypothetical protein
MFIIAAYKTAAFVASSQVNAYDNNGRKESLKKVL